MAIQAVLFDLDDTIIDHKHCFQTSLKHLRDTFEVLAPLSLGELEDLYQSLLDRFHQYVLAGEYTVAKARYERFKALFLHVGYDATEGEIQEITTVYQTVYAREERLIPGAADLMLALRHAGIPLGLVTNHTSAEQRAKLQRHQLELLFDAIAISGELGVAKPNRGIFEMTLRWLDCRVDQAVMVGDSWERDVMGAVAMGMKAVWLNRYNSSNCTHDAVREIHAYIPLDNAFNVLTQW